MLQVKLLLLAIAGTLATAENKINPRIVKGQDAAHAQFPFYAYLEVRTLSEDGPAIVDCGGSLISNEFILTAGHCLVNATSAKVHLGSLRIADQNEPGRKMFEVPPENLKIFPDFSYVFFMNK